MNTCFLLLTVPRVPVKFHILHRGSRDTKLCPYLVNFATLYFSLTVSHPTGLPLFSCHRSSPSLSAFVSTFASTSSAALYLASVRSVTACYHHRIPNHPPRVLSVSSYRSIIDCVAMKCATLLCLLLMYSPIASNYLSSIAVAAKVYSHFPSCCLFGNLPVNRFYVW